MHTSIYIFRKSTGCFALKNIFFWENTLDDLHLLRYNV